MSKESIKKIIPGPIWKAGSQTYWWWCNRGRHVVAKMTSPVWNANINRLSAYKNIHAGKRAIIIGNGPSLKQMDLRPVKNEITFGANRIYLMFPEIGFTTMRRRDGLVGYPQMGNLASTQALLPG
jgi:hypothetical protein